jgi:alkylhydroperoxidase family enzyme
MTANTHTDTAPITTWLPSDPTDSDTDVLAVLPVGYPELRALYARLWDAGIDPVTLELCRLRAAAVIGSDADLSVRDPRAVAAGLDEQAVEALRDWPTSPRFTEAQRAALRFAEQYVIDPHGFSDGDQEILLRHFDGPQLATLTIAVALFDCLARVRSVLTAGPTTTTTLSTRDAEIGVALT